MSATYEDTVSDFDLSFLNQSAESAALKAERKYNLLKTQVLFMKQKVMIKDVIVNKYKAVKSILEETEKNLVAAKEECKQTCIEHRSTLAKCTQVENELNETQNSLKRTEEEYINYKNQCKALESHTNQLQLLLKEKDAIIDSFKLEKSLDKPSVKDYEKKMRSFEKEKYNLLKDISLFTDLVKKLVGKRKLKPKYNTFLRKYDCSSDGDKSDGGDNSDNEIDIFEDSLFSPPRNINQNMVKKFSTKYMAPIESDNDYNNEVVSVDTGRGSSLACSDIEKCLHSPDYFLDDSPLNSESCENKVKAKVVSVATSPVIFKEIIEVVTNPIPFIERTAVATSPIQLNRRIEVATSPIQLKERSEVATSPIQLKERSEVATSPIQLKERSEVATSPIQLKERSEVATSPIPLQERIEVATSPIQFKEIVGIANSPITVHTEEQDNICESFNLLVEPETHFKSCIDSSVKPININNNKSVCTSPIEKVTRATAASQMEISDNSTINKHAQETNEKECLELNNSNNLRCDNHTDFEIEMILNTMQLNHDVVTPIPRTPSRNRCAGSRIRRPSEHPIQCSNPEITKESPEIEELKKELMSVKNILKAHILLTSAQLQFNHEPLISKLITGGESGTIINIEDCNKIVRPENIVNSTQNYVFEDPIINPNPSTETLQYDMAVSPDVNVLPLDSNQLSTETDTNILQNKQVKNKLSNMEQNHDDLDELADENEMFPDIDNVIKNNADINQIPNKKRVKKVKRKQLSKLDQIKKKLKPKYKIRTETPSLVRSRIKPRQLILAKKKKVTDSDNSASLNDKDVYAKAVKVMAEINSSQGCKLQSCSSKPIDPHSPKLTTVLEEQSKSSIVNPEQIPPNSTSDSEQGEAPKSPHEITKDLVSVKVTTQSEENVNHSKQTSFTSELNTKDSCIEPTPESTSNLLSPKISTEVKDHLDNNQNCKKATSKSELNPKQASEVPKTLLNPVVVLLSPKSKTPLKVCIDNGVHCKQPLLKPKLNLNYSCETSNTPSKVSGDLTSTNIATRPEQLIVICHKTALPDSNSNSKQCQTIRDPPKRVGDVLSTNLTIQVEDNDCSGNCKQTSSNLELNPKLGCITPKSPPIVMRDLLSPKSRTKLKEHVDSSLNIKQTSPRSKSNSEIVTYSPKSPSKPIRELLSPKHRTGLKEHVDSSVNCNQTSLKCSITTRSKRKIFEQMDHCTVILTKSPLAANESKNSTAQTDKNENETIDFECEQLRRKRRMRLSIEPEIKCKRILRSSTVHQKLNNDNNTEEANAKGDINRKSIDCSNLDEIKLSDIKLRTAPHISKHENTLQHQQPESNVITYDDLDVFAEDRDDMQRIDIQPKTQSSVTSLTSCPEKEINTSSSSCHPKESILCCMINKYGVQTVRPLTKKISDITANFVWEKLEREIARIMEAPPQETKNAMNNLVADLQKLNYKHFIIGMIKYLTSPNRRAELVGKMISPPAPPMTKPEQILLYVISHLKSHWPSVDIVDAVLSNIEYTLFKLNRSPEFDVIDSASHFYALLCRYFRAKSRLRLFILDAMYCLQYKSVPLIKQCLDVWMHIIPLAHMGIAQNPLVTCLVYLLHFYKCEDKFNKVQEIRNILSRKYFYKITDWNETRILEMFRNSIKDIKDIPIERKMLRLALIILAKRHGPRWCQNNIMKNLLQPIIEKENVPNIVKEFCVSMIGPLMKPYPADMKVYCEISLNLLLNILDNEPTPEVEEAAMTSLMFLSRHNQYTVNQTLLMRKIKPLSPDLEAILRDYVKTKPLKVWMNQLSRIGRP